MMIVSHASLFVDDEEVGINLRQRIGIAIIEIGTRIAFGKKHGTYQVTRPKPGKP